MKELESQVALNAELLAQGFGMTVDAQAHSALVDSQRVQVLTQISGRRIDLPANLFETLYGPFAMNVARHLVRKLKDPKQSESTAHPEKIKGYVEPLRLLLIEEFGHSTKSAEDLMRRNNAIVCEGMMRGNFTLRSAAMALEMADGSPISVNSSLQLDGREQLKTQRLHLTE